jgi:hypothetical protein
MIKGNHHKKDKTRFSGGTNPKWRETPLGILRWLMVAGKCMFFLPANIQVSFPRS